MFSTWLCRFCAMILMCLRGRLHILSFAVVLSVVGVKTSLANAVAGKSKGEKDCRTSLASRPPFNDYLISAVKKVFPDFYRSRGYAGLTHFTPRPGLTKILKSGVLKAAAQLTNDELDLTRNLTGDRTKIYMGFTSREFDALIPPQEATRMFSMLGEEGSGFPGKNGPYNFNTVFLFFDLSVVATTYEYHIVGDYSAGYGAFDPKQDFLYDPRQLLQYRTLLQEFFSRNSRVGEVAFHPNDDFLSIDLSNLVGAWVADCVWQETIVSLKNEGISSYKGKPIEEFIRPIPIGEVIRRSDGKFEFKNNK